jgi:hypothetical protein
MNDITRMILEVAVGTGTTAMLVRQIAKQAIQHFFETQKLSFATELERASKAQETELQLWSTRQLELFRYLIEAKSVAIHHLVQNASLLRRAIYGIGEERDPKRLHQLYRDYWESFYADPILPRRLFDAAHQFRQLADKMVGACGVAGPKGQLAEELVTEFDDSYAALLDEARAVLLPTPETVS